MALMAGPDAAMTALAWAALAARRGRASRKRIVELFGERGFAVASVDEVLVAAGGLRGPVPPPSLRPAVVAAGPRPGRSTPGS